MSEVEQSEEVLVQPQGKAAHTLLFDGRISAYLWPPISAEDQTTQEDAPSENIELGFIARGGLELLKLSTIDFARIVILDRSQEQVLVDIAERSDSIEAVIFSAGVEGFVEHSGQIEPSLHRRRF